MVRKHTTFQRDEKVCKCHIALYYQCSGMHEQKTELVYPSCIIDTLPKIIRLSDETVVSQNVPVACLKCI